MKNRFCILLCFALFVVIISCQKTNEVPPAEENITGEILSCSRGDEPTEPVGDCGRFRTQTQGGWGARPYGNNAGTYSRTNFAAAFPSGLRVGCDAGYSILFTSAAAIWEYLPASGTASVLRANASDPDDRSIRNVLLGQVTALALNVGFDNHDPNFSPAEELLGNLSIRSGAFTGKSVYEFLLIANDVLGGCNTEFTPYQVNQTATLINENFRDGNVDRGYLGCPTVRFTER